MHTCTENPDDLAATLAHYAALVRAQMRQALDAYAEPRDFYGMMRYHLGWVDERLEPVAAAHGKGLRAALLLLVNDALGGDEADAAPLAAAVELLHNFSLVHDDIEDASRTRRHRRTMWAIWGVPLTINAGDGLYAIAHLALYQSPLRRRAPDRFVDITEQFERAVLRLAEGQHLDMVFERMADVPVDDYLRMIGGKSAALIGAAAAMGACAAGATAARAEACDRCGRELGLAFQMQDDILGIWGDEAVTGKSAVGDLASRKKTLPVVLAMTHAEPEARARLRHLYARSGDDDAALREIMALLDGAGARGLAEAYLQRHWDAAMRALDEVGLPAPARARLEQFARLFIDRSA